MRWCVHTPRWYSGRLPGWYTDLFCWIDNQNKRPQGKKTIPASNRPVTSLFLRLTSASAIISGPEKLDRGASAFQVVLLQHKEWINTFGNLRTPLWICTYQAFSADCRLKGIIGGQLSSAFPKVSWLNTHREGPAFASTHKSPFRVNGETFGGVKGWCHHRDVEKRAHKFISRYRSHKCLQNTKRRQMIKWSVAKSNFNPAKKLHNDFDLDVNARFLKSLFWPRFAFSLKLTPFQRIEQQIWWCSPVAEGTHRVLAMPKQHYRGEFKIPLTRHI